MNTLKVQCPECGAEMRVDAENGAVIEHRPAPKKSRSLDLDRAGEQLRREQAARDARFEQAQKAEKNRDALLDEKFREQMKRVKDSPDTGRPLRDFDLD